MAFVPVTVSRPQVLPPLFTSRRLYVHIFLLLIIVLILVVVRFMSHVRLTFVHYHMESDTDAELVTLPKSFAREKGAFCLDGSPPAYYYRPSPIISSNLWIIYLPGGGWCVSEEDCFQRSLTSLGSSHVAPTSLSMDGFLSKNCNNNPDFCWWNVLIFHYCDGGSFLGNQSHNVDFKSRSLYMRGGRIFEALIEYLMSTTGLKDAEQIILSGTSAGGIGALIHTDLLRSRLPPSVKTLHVLVDGAMFVDVPDVDGQRSMAKMLSSFYHLHSVKDATSIQECTRTMKKEDTWRCLLPQVYQSFVFTPAFFIQSIYDTWQRTNVLKVPCFAVTCPEAHLDEVYKARDAVQSMAQQIMTSRKNGVFLTVCPAHTILIRPYFYKKEVGNPTIQKSLSSWLQHSEVQTHVDVNLPLEAAVEMCQTA
ncbi:pectin acetylesterase 5 [Aplysia californica]|uniref:Pectin acetylesterase 5 n=1 Tax=Aplysia californica TaxID=6500 RepID=A0ABM0K898_APLCA|nr:pectin acetylesterase 5 [Aplysia californica]